MGALFLGAMGPAAIPILGGTLLVQPPVLTVALTLGGAAGQPGAGSGSVPLSLPNNQALIGLRLNFQAMFVDPGAGSGVSMTNGLEAWIG